MAETSISGIEFKIVGTTGKAKTAVDKLTESLRGLKTALSTTSAKKLGKDLEDVEKSSKKTTTTLGKLFKSVGRIGFYRAIRSALKYITEGFREGLQNAYQFSKVVGYDLAATMDNLATKSLTMKNQLGSAFGSLIMAVEPILLQLIALVTRAANALAQFFAAIGGKETYLKAIDTVTQYGEAVGGVGQAAKEAMRYLAPFDELNVLPAQNEPGGGGGGASTPDYSQMFEESPVMQKLAEFGASLRLSFNDMFIDWDDLTPEQISEKIIGAILGLTGFLAGIAITGSLTGGLVVGIAGVAAALVFNSVVFDHDGVLDKSEIQSMLRLALMGITGGIIGFTIGGPGGALIGASIGFGLDALLKAINFFTDGKLEGAMEGLVRGISAGLGGVIGFMIGGPAGAVLGATIGLGISFGLENFVFGDTTGWSTGDWIRNIVATLAPVAGAAIGLVVGGPAGALVGATIGLGIQFALNADTTDGAEKSGKTIGEKILEGIEKPFKSIGNWIKEHIIDPIKEKLQNFSLTELLFGNGGEDDSGMPAAGSAASFGYEVEVTGIKDSIPTEKRTLKDFFADLFGTKDSVPEEKKTIGGFFANLFGVKDKELTKEQKTIPVYADYRASIKKNMTKPDSTLPTWADFKAAIKSHMTKPDSTLPTYADFKASIKSHMTKPDSTLDATADFKASKKSNMTKPDSTLPTWADFRASIKSNMTKADSTLDTTAKFKSRSDALTNDQKSFKTTSIFSWIKDKLTNDDKTIPTTARFESWFRDKTKWINGGESMTSIPIIARFENWFRASAWLNGGDDMTSVPMNAKFGDWLRNWATWDSTIDGMTAKFTGYTGIDTVSAKLTVTQVLLNDDAWAQYEHLTRKNGGVFSGGVWRNIPQYASGGRPHGTMFVAGEAGPEVVGHIGGRTEVLNRSQLAATMYAAVKSAMSGFRFNIGTMNIPSASADSYDEEAMYRAMLRALNDSDVFPDEIDLDGDVVYRKMVQRNRSEKRRLGVNPMMAS